MISFNKNVFPFLRSVYFIFVIVYIIVFDEIFLLLYHQLWRSSELVRCIAVIVLSSNSITQHEEKRNPKWQL